MSSLIPYTIFPLGDTALSIDFGNTISEAVSQKITSLFHELRNDPVPGIADIIPAYSSLTLIFDTCVPVVKMNGMSAFEWVYEQVVKRMERGETRRKHNEPRKINVPVCYAPEFGWDLESMEEQTGLRIEEIIRIHTAQTYLVYMLGFLPGFAYMGKVDDRIALPRKAQPRVKIAPGSVGIAGSQTGVYPLESPGGWQIIGRTPLTLFNKNSKKPVLFEPGDQVTFYAITQNEFTHYQSRHA